MLRQHDSSAIDAVQAAVAIKAARSQARHLSRRLRAQPADEQDFQQSLLLDVIARSVRFDAERGAWHSFVANVTHNAAGRIAQRHIRHERASTSLAAAHDRPDGAAPIGSAHIGIDFKRAALRLPQHLRDFLDRVAEYGSVAAARRASGSPTASFYRDLNELRLMLLAEGASLGSITQFEQSKRQHRSRA